MNIFKPVTNFFGRIVRDVKPKMPDLLMWGGVIGVVGGTGLLCKAMVTDVPEIMDNYRREKEHLENQYPETKLSAETRAEKKKKLRKLKLNTGLKIGKKAAPGAAVELLSLTGMCTSHHMMKKINTELAVTCVGLKAGWDQYRESVREEFGEETDDRLMHGYEEKTITEMAEDGTTVEKKIKVIGRDRNMPSQYARIFAYGEADGAERSADYNRQFLALQEQNMNCFFKANRRMMLNDVYDMLGIKRSVAGNHVGWVYDKNNPSGDNKINLRVQELQRENPDKPGEYETVFLIDPNVDGMMEQKAVALGLMDE